MKENLRTFPEPENSTRSCMEWAAAFEKEIRQRIRKLERADRTAYGKELLLEILGEV